MLCGDGLLAEGVVPGGEERLPRADRGGGAIHHLGGVPEEALDAGALKDPAYSPGPAFERPWWPTGPPWFADGEPVAPQGENRPEKLAAGSGYPTQEVGVFELLWRSIPGLRHLGVHPDPIASTRQDAPDLYVVSGRDPGRALRERGDLGVPEDPVLPHRRGQYPGPRGVPQLRPEVIDHDDRAAGPKNRRDLLPRLLVVVRWGHH